MTKPAKRTQKDKISLYLKRQVWVLFILIVIASMLDIFWLHSELVVAKSSAIGALLSFATQAVFAGFIFWRTGYRARRHIVSQLYRGQMVKWLLTVLGFALIFIMVQPLSAPALFVGFIVMQLSHSLMLSYIR
ncbi:ATP synthase subunit I [Psychrobacter sp. LV10R520-6]|uniref:ATP synthase subunit I n=1 Tax=Psychrobacter sp. LV10R520-6 TaxID=1415574 RepID=UPI0024C73D6F|nr:ATP synthase subunit I [Psychrobacter sp. LV10R520-6]SNT70908.1 ATP synthase protein I [Psychrobacter sp. LV10R520-6]